ncbi:MAG: molybdenum cofactor biosynthesis protein MoaE [Gemmatimonadales bacterium]
MGYLAADPIDLSPLVARVKAPERGGITTFLGVVRDHHEGRGVRRLEYSAYGPMAEAECRRIVTEAKERWGAEIALQHRTGRLEVGDVAVAIAAAAPHRDQAFAACRYVIEEVKRRVPIWKQEYYADGTVAWVDPTRSAAAARPRGETPTEVAVRPGQDDWAV